MSARHTHGKLAVRTPNNAWPILVPAGATLDPPIAKVDCSISGQSRPYSEACANADRLALCWNWHDDMKGALETILKNPSVDPTETARAILTKVNAV